MTTFQMGLTIAVCTAATMLTRFLPFLIFSSKDQQPPEVVQYLGRVLPAAIFGMLILYCLKSVTPFAGSHGIPEAIAIAVTIAVCTAATMLTRFLPFLIFSSKDQQPPEVVQYLGRVLPAAIFGMLILYCLKSVTPFAGSHGIPEAIAIAVTIALHRWKHQTLVSITGGTVCYVLLVQLVFA